MTRRTVQSFRRSFFTLLGGTAFARVLSLLATPLFTRLFSPEQFGVMTALAGVASILSVFITMRYELAILLPRDEIESCNLLALAGSILAVMSLLIEVSLLLAGPMIVDTITPLSKIGSWILALGPISFLIGLGLVLSAWANRIRRYSDLATSEVATQATHIVVAATLGAFHLSSNGLIWGRVCGLIASSSLLMIRMRDSLFAAIRNATWSEMVRLAKRHGQFPLLNVPYTALGTLSRELLVISLLTFEYPEAAGHFALVRGVMLAPISFLSFSLGQLFFREAAEHFGTARLEHLTMTALRRLSVPIAPLVAWFMYWSTDLFALVFGESWRSSGSMAAAYAPVAFLFLLTSWPERLYEVAEKQAISLSIEVAGNAAKLIAVLMLLYGGSAPLTVVTGFACVECVHRVSYLIGLFVVGKLPLRLLRGIFYRCSCTAIAGAMFTVAMKYLPVPLAAQAALGLLGVAGIGSLVAYRYHRAAIVDEHEDRNR